MNNMDEETKNGKYYNNYINNKYSYFYKIPLEIKDKIYKYLSYYDILNLRMVNKIEYELLKKHLEKYFISKRYIENISRVTEHEDKIKKIIYESFPSFPINTLKLHKYDYEFIFKEKKLHLVINFTYFNNDHYHKIQLIKDNNGIVNFIVYEKLKNTEFCSFFQIEVLTTKIYDYDYDENGNLLFQDEYIKIINNKDRNFKKLSKKMGFENSYLEIYEMFMNISIYYLKTKTLNNMDINGIMNGILENINI
jgi:hypothetical protein